MAGALLPASVTVLGVTVVFPFVPIVMMRILLRMNALRRLRRKRVKNWQTRRSLRMMWLARPGLGTMGSSGRGLRLMGLSRRRLRMMALSRHGLRMLGFGSMRRLRGGRRIVRRSSVNGVRNRCRCVRLLRVWRRVRRWRRVGGCARWPGRRIGRIGRRI